MHNNRSVIRKKADMKAKHRPSFSSKMSNTYCEFCKLGTPHFDFDEEIKRIKKQLNHRTISRRGKKPAFTWRAKQFKLGFSMTLFWKKTHE